MLDLKNGAGGQANFGARGRGRRRRRRGEEEIERARACSPEAKGFKGTFSASERSGAESRSNWSCCDSWEDMG